MQRVAFGGLRNAEGQSPLEARVVQRVAFGGLCSAEGQSPLEACVVQRACHLWRLA